MKIFYNPNIDIENDDFPMEKFIEFKEDTYDVIGSSFLSNIKNNIDQVAEVEVLEDECRFDILSWKNLKSSDYWWLLMEFNEKMDWEIRSNEKIKIPNLTGIYMLEQETLLQYNRNRMD